MQKAFRETKVKLKIFQCKKIHIIKIVTPVESDISNKEENCIIERSDAVSYVARFVFSGINGIITIMVLTNETNYQNIYFFNDLISSIRKFVDGCATE